MSDVSALKVNGLVRSGAERGKILLRANIVLLVALLVLAFILPVLPRKSDVLLTLLLCIAVVSGLFAADFSRSAFKILFTVGSLVVAVTLLNLFLNDSESLNILTFLLNTLFFIMVTIALVVHVAGAKKVDGSTLLCAINSYLLIGLTLAILMLIVHITQPGSFNNVDLDSSPFSALVYYSYVTLTTLGYGDITPATPLARSLSAFTALFGQLYLVIIMAIIIGKYLINKKAAD